MPVPQQLLEILVCTACKQPVKLTDRQDGLRCASCRRVYPVVDDIPVMLIDQATLG